ncbi:unnamed protein product, partial [Aureobasidium uvarum]
MTDGASEGGRDLDLEKELSCSEWFAWQASSKGHVYSCPACRAVVRDTRPNATLSTLLDMFLQAHPDKGKTAQEKLDMDKTYKPGDNVIPPVDLGQVSDDEDEQEQQMLAQARELSLNDVGLGSRSRESTHTRQNRRRDDSPRSARADALSHQSSIRSLLSQSDVDFGDMEDEIMRHIIDHGLLDGVDINNLTPDQEEAITDSIARAYRSRRRQDRRERHHNRDRSTARPSPRPSSHRHSPHSSSYRHSPSTSTHRHSPSSSSHRRTTSTATTVNPHASTPIETQPLPARRRATSAHHFHRIDTTSDQRRHLAPNSPLRPLNHSSPALPIPLREESVTDVHAPSISCSRCEKPDIQYSLHYNCDKCSGGSFNLCLGCYRAGKGCLNWHGFGRAASARYRPQAGFGADHADYDLPHVLSARRYDQNTARLKSGLFCDGCQAFANACYWYCNTCNDGAWGFCNVCVEQGKHCTHPLTSVAHTSQAPTSSQRHSPSELYPPPLTPTNSAFHFAVPSTSVPLLPHVPDPSSYIPIALASYCDICHYSIPPSHARFHCNTCNKGNYDICNSCYHSLVNTGKITRDNGPSGWRRCPHSHRMNIIAHEDHNHTTHRIVLLSMVGGHALKDSIPSSQEHWRWKENDGTPKTASAALFTASSSPQAFPPSGGIGLTVQALWSYFPGDGVKDELSFPRHAIVTEVEDINGDWFWGVYAGAKGLFPGNYVRVV